jgi:hypothetical protein
MMQQWADDLDDLADGGKVVVGQFGEWANFLRLRPADPRRWTERSSGRRSGRAATLTVRRRRKRYLSRCPTGEKPQSRKHEEWDVLRRARQSKLHPDRHSAKIKSTTTKKILAILSRRDNYSVAATASKPYSLSHPD